MTSMLVHKGDVIESVKAFISSRYGAEALKELSDSDYDKLYKNNLDAKEMLMDELNTLANYISVINFAYDVQGGAIKSSFNGYGDSLQEDMDEYMYHTFLNGGSQNVD